MRMVFLMIAVLSTLQVPAQIHSRTLMSDQDSFFEKSRRQKTLGKIALFTGTATALTGGYLWFMAPLAGLSGSGNVEGAERTGKALAAAGAGVALISIPLFIASRKNLETASIVSGTSSVYVPDKGPAMQMTVGIRMPL